MRNFIERNQISKIKDWNRSILILLFITILNSNYSLLKAQKIGPRPIIFEADFASDVEDLGTLAYLHSLEHEGKIHILAIICSTNNDWSPLCISAINEYFGRPTIPIGMQKKESITGDSKFISGYTYNKYLATHFNHSLKSKNETQDVIPLLKSLLEKPENEDIVYVSSGNLINLSELLNVRTFWTKSGVSKELIKQKISQLIITNGAYPKNDQDYHFITNLEATAKVVVNWPNPILYVGQELNSVYPTGPGLISIARQNNPIRTAYLLFDKYYYPTFEPGYKGNYIHKHPSRAQIGLYYLLNPKDPTFTLSPSGGNYVNSDGANFWIPDNGRKDHYLISKIKSPTLSHQIEIGMAYQPKK